MVKQIFFVRETGDTTKQRGKRRSTEPGKGEESSEMIGGSKAFFPPLWFNFVGFQTQERRKPCGATMHAGWNTIRNSFVSQPVKGAILSGIVAREFAFKVSANSSTERRQSERSCKIRAAVAWKKRSPRSGRHKRIQRRREEEREGRGKEEIEKEGGRRW